jgi:hypothetical protein
MVELQGKAFFIIPRSIFSHYSISSQNSIQAFASRRQVLSMTVKWKPGESRLPQLSGETPRENGHVAHSANSILHIIIQIILGICNRSRTLSLLVSISYPPNSHQIRDSRKIKLFWDPFSRRRLSTGSYMYTASALTVGILGREWATLIWIAILQVFLCLSSRWSIL